MSRKARGFALPSTVALTLTALLSGCAGSSEPSNDTAPNQALENIAERLVDIGYPGATVALTDPDGSHHLATAGVGDRESGSEMPTDGEVRIGSASKTFTAVVVLQLAEEGLLGLDQSVESLSPGLLRGEGVDAEAITVRHLLQHTSGLPEYADLIAADPFAYAEIYQTPQEVLRTALERPATSAPGETYSYSNTGYITLGLIAEQLTGEPLEDLIDRRITRPLDLEHTYLPHPEEREFRGQHPKGYHTDKEGSLRDISEADPYWTWAAGAMISTPAELNEFMRAIVAGELLDEVRHDEMLTGIPTGEELLPGSTYGLGLESVELSCGTAWGHSGDIPGYQTRNAVAEDGTAFTVTVTALPFAIFDGPEEELLERYLMVIDTLDEALCGTQP